MSDQIPMPKVIDATPPSSPRDYAPKRGLEAVAEAVAHTPGAGYKAPLPYPSQVNSQHTATIKDAIKKLTHREMREMVAAIFAARDKVESDRKHPDGVGDMVAIAKDDMADVLDAFAYGREAP